MFDALDVARTISSPQPQFSRDVSGSLDGVLSAPTGGPGGRPFEPQNVLYLKAGEFLFRAGDVRSCAYRVDSGALRHVVSFSDRPADVIGFAFPGDVIGLGFLSRHATTAEATLDARVSPVDMKALDARARTEPQLEDKIAAAVEIEFSVLRDRAIAAGRGKSVERISAYLLAAASLDEREGNRGMVWDALPSGYVAVSLGLSIEALAAGLAALEHHGLIAPVRGGIHILNVLALALFSEPVFTEAVADPV